MATCPVGISFRMYTDKSINFYMYRTKQPRMLQTCVIFRHEKASPYKFWPKALSSHQITTEKRAEKVFLQTISVFMRKTEKSPWALPPLLDKPLTELSLMEKLMDKISIRKNMWLCSWRLFNTHSKSYFLFHFSHQRNDSRTHLDQRNLCFKPHLSDAFAQRTGLAPPTRLGPLIFCLKRFRR